jgi:hypothetical protein
MQFMHNFERLVLFMILFDLVFLIYFLNVCYNPNLSKFFADRIYLELL